LSKVNPQIVKQLLNAGADPNIKNKKGDFPILSLVENSYVAEDIILQLLTLLLGNGAKVDSRATRTIAGKDYNETALVAATRQGHTEVVKVLLEFGASVDIPINGDDLLPLGLSIKLKHLNIARVFFENGARHCYANSRPLDRCVDIAVGSRDFDIIQLVGFHADKSDKIHSEL